jgi:class 3 adenylate cyclase
MAILFSDIVNYSALMGKDENQALQVLSENRKIHLRNLSAYNGRMLKEIGDGILACFDSVSDAVDCGILIQRDVQQAKNFQLRMGIHLGEVNTENNDAIGDGVNIASRIQSVAEPGMVFISGAVYDNIRNKQTLQAEFIGDKTLKNIAEPVRVYRVKSTQE